LVSSVLSPEAAFALYPDARPLRTDPDGGLSWQVARMAGPAGGAPVPVRLKLITLADTDGDSPVRGARSRAAVCGELAVLQALGPHPHLLAYRASHLVLAARTGGAQQACIVT